MKVNKMESTPMPKLMITMSIPAIVSMLIQALYNIVDSIFVSKIGESALTAVSLAFPIQMIIIALCVGTGAGISSTISRKLGEKENDFANKAANHGIIITIIYSIIMFIVGLLFIKYIVNIFTDNTELQDLTTQYISIILMFSFGRFIAQAGQSTLQATGDTIHPMETMIAGAILNIILDPILIFGWFGLPALGVRGAAIATVIAQIFSMVCITLILFRKKHHVEINLKNFKFDKKVTKEIYKVGLPAIVMQAIGSFMISGLNLILIGFSSTAVAVLGVYYKLQSFVFMPVFGLCQGFMPIIGYNYGAKNKKRMIESYKIAIFIALCFMIAGTIVFKLFPRNLMSLFNSSPEMTEIGISALTKISWCFPLAALGIISSTAFQAMGHGVNSLISSVIRQLVLLLPCAYILSKFIEIDGVWYSFIISELISISIILPWLYFTFKKEFKKFNIQDDDKKLSA